MTPGNTVEVTIDFPKGTSEVSGVLNLRRVVDSTGSINPDPPTIESHSLSYSGPPIDHLATLIDAPQYTGVYELAYVSSGTLTPVAATTELFVLEV